MSVELPDIATATSAYIHDHVEVSIARVTSNLEPGEPGTLTLRWTNADAPAGVRLSQVFLHLSVSPAEPDSVAKLKVPGSALLQPRAVPDPTAPRLTTGTLVEELYLFLPEPSAFDHDFDSVLDVGESAELSLGYEAIRAGTATFSAHIHASVTFEDLFPSDRGTAGTRDTVVKAPRSVSA